MKKIFTLLMLVIMTACSSSVMQPDWDLIRSVGGLRVSDPYMESGQYFLPVQLDVARYKQGSKAALVCTGASARVGGGKIFLHLSTDAAVKNPRASTKCPDARLGLIPDGQYEVIYVGPGNVQTPVTTVTVDLAEG